MTDSVSRYQIYCNTEAKYVSGWSTTPPTVCFNVNTHSVNDAKISTLETVLNKNAAGLTQSIYKYKIYCITESAYITGWSSTSPTTCFNNTTHSVNTNSVQTIDIVENSQVKIKEDNLVIPRNYSMKSIVFNNVEALTSQDQYFKFEIPTSMYSFSFIADDTNKGDYLSISANSDTVLGLIGANISPGARTLVAPAALLLYGYLGFNLVLTDGTNTDDIGIITIINKITGVVTFNIATTHSFSSTNTLVKMSYYSLKNYQIGAPGRYPFSEDIVGGTSIPIGTNVKFTYTNNATTVDLTNDPKSLVISMQLLF